MKRTAIIMGMPITVEVIGRAARADIDAVFTYFRAVDRRYSTYRSTSEVSRINAGLAEEKWSSEMRWVLELCGATKRATHGYFDSVRDGYLDPSGLVKGWAIQNAANLLRLNGCRDFYIEAGGDVQAQGRNRQRQAWRVGIRNPRNMAEIVKVIQLDNGAVATSGTYVRGSHIYNPLDPSHSPEGAASLSVVAPTIYDADRFATAAFAMGRAGITFVESTPGLEGYMIDTSGVATYTSGFERYVV
jgi:thiamine biosynthesis lipoprotein